MSEIKEVSLKEILNNHNNLYISYAVKDNNGKFIWSGFGENLRVLEWILARCNNKVDAQKTPIGYMPRSSDIDMAGLELPDSAMQKLLEIDIQEWLKELTGIKGFFKKFKKDLPQELWDEFLALKSRLESHA